MGKTSIRALILDYGGVISQPQNPENVSHILQILKQAGSGFPEVYRRQRSQYDRAQISGEQYWLNIAQHYGLEPHGFDLARLVQEDVQSWTQLNAAMLQLITEARRKIHRLAMLSNMTRDTLAFMSSHYGWLELFDVLCFSCELGVAKPDREIYETCLRMLQVSAQACLFVDDSVRNVSAAREAGMSAILFTSFAGFKQELEEQYAFTR